MSNLPPSKNKRGEAIRISAGSRSGAAAAPGADSAEKQLANFENASKLFHARKFREAQGLFLLAAEGPERDVAHRASLHATMCGRRLEQAEVQCDTAEDCYNYAVALLNTRKTDEAQAYLRRALEMEPDSDHVHYGLALVGALAGDAAAAHDHLKRAIELDPKNRLMARQDVDFAAVAGHPHFQALLYPEKKSW
ncbi:MAG: tetratricopeptide repeat protein [Acidobacteriia bacterium]|nr:tetratricopeptide repeat protein [Terriglobia bacterium]